MMETGTADTILYSGSFNPIHRGHLAVAEQVLQAFPGSELWLVVSPQNPLKNETDSRTANSTGWKWPASPYGTHSCMNGCRSATSNSRCPNRRLRSTPCKRFPPGTHNAVSPC
ncbi:MAG: adenylyltransferase/cytidyltransferase family protein [Alistipes indistinctus]